MAKIKLVETGAGFIDKAAKNELLKITSCEYNPDFGKVTMTLADQSGKVMNNNFNLLNADGSNNEGALKAFSYFAKVALGDWDRDDVEDTDLINCYIRGDISLNEGKEKSKTGETMWFANLDKVYMTEDKFTKTKAKKAVQEQEEAAADDEDDFDWE